VVGKKDMGKKDHGGPLQPGKVYSSIWESVTIKLKTKVYP
jgi:hypothetical protein